MSTLDPSSLDALAEGIYTPPPVVGGSVLLIDGDILAYNFAGNDDTSPFEAVSRLNTFLDQIAGRVGAETIRVFLTAPYSHKRHRYVIATVKPYQGRRSGTKPKNWERLRVELEHHPKAVMVSDREADDSIAAAAMRAAIKGEVAFILTKDKDMRMLPGTHVVFDTLAQVKVGPDDFCVEHDGKVYGSKWFWLQMLQGDAVDNIPGLERVVAAGKEKKVGEKTASDMLAEADSSLNALEIVVRAYQSFYEDTAYDRVVEQMALLWLSRRSDAKDWIPPAAFTNPGLRDAMIDLRGRVHAQVEAG